MASSLIFAGLETVVNRTIPLDPIAEQRLSALDGRAVAIQTSGPNLQATVYFIDNRIQIHQGIDHGADALITGPVADLARQAMSGDEFAVGGPVEVSGQLDLVKEMHDIARTLDIDWEEPLSGVLGDPIAHQVGQVGRGLFRWAKKGAQTFLQEASTFVRDDTKAVADREELNQFHDAIDDLGMDVDRLEQRLQRLKQAAAGSKES